MSIPVPIHDSKGWGLENDSNYSSQTGSPEQPSSSLDYFSLSVSQSKTAESSSALPKRPPDAERKPPRRAQGPAYIGPKLSDEDETSDEEADFEKFKMQTRIEKIMEFHREAAQADMELALTLHNDRKEKKSNKASDALKVQEHGKQMLRLQAKKEEERKALVEAERGKRRNEIRKRSALREPARAANTNTHQSWDTWFDSQSVRLDIDSNGKLMLRREEPSNDESENQMWDLNPLDMPRGRKPSVSREMAPVAPTKQSGWKATPTSSTSTSSSQPQWPTASAATPIPQRKAEQPSWFSGSTHPLAQSTSFDDDEFQLPGGFPGGAKATPAPGPVTSGWTKKVVPGTGPAPTVSSSSTSIPIETKSVPISVSPPSSTSLKKSNKKQRPGTKKPAVETTSKDDVDTLSTEHELELSSTPRPTIPNMMKSFKLDDVASTPRPSGLRRLHDPSAAGNSAVKEETLWERMAKKSENTKTTQASSYTSESEESVWAQMTKQGSRAADPRLDSSWARKMSQQSAFQEPHIPSFPASAEIEEETLWGRVMKQGSRGTDTSVPVQSKATPYGTVEEESPWEMMKKRGLLGGNAPSSHTSQGKVSKTSPNVSPPAPAEREETPWERMERMKAQGQDVGSTSLKTKLDQTSAPKPGQRAVNPNMWMPSDVPTTFPSNIAPPQPRPNEEKFWTPGGGTTAANHRQGWNHPIPQSDNSYATSSQNQHASDALRSRLGSFVPQAQEADKRQTYVPTSIMKGSKAKKTVKGKTVMIEEISDEEGPDGHKGPGGKLPPNSRSILDIIEPKPSVPTTMFTNIFQYGEGEDEEDYDTGLSSMAPTPSTAPTSPPGEVPAMDDEWLSSMTEDIKNGDWDKVMDTGVPKSMAKAMYSPWSHGFNDNSASHSLDSAKLFSALESVDDKPSPPTLPASKRTASPPRPAVVEKKAPEPKEPEKKEPEKKEPEKKEPAKPPPATKAKAKAKGKGRK
ncbi:hypothetical protein BDZ94DRAFT_1267475 [Collybia nuda]|nr:hypothetical protein BDZ94DRAFT_1267475 [Collybia nuda]